MPKSTEIQDHDRGKYLSSLVVAGRTTLCLDPDEIRKWMKGGKHEAIIFVITDSNPFQLIRFVKAHQQTSNPQVNGSIFSYLRILHPETLLATFQRVSDERVQTLTNTLEHDQA